MTPTSVPATVPEFRRGWRVLLLALLGAATNPSVTLLYGFGAMVLPLQAAFGWDRAALQITIAFLSAGVVVASQIAGWFNLRWGVRRVTLVSLPLSALAYLGVTQIASGSSIAWLYLAFFLVPIAASGCTFVTWTQVVNQWFDRHRGLALALVLCGSGISAAVLPAAITWSTGRWDWRAAFVLLGLLAFFITWPLVWRFLIPTPPLAGAKPGAPIETVRYTSGYSFGEALRLRRYWVMNIALTLVVSAVVGMVTNTVPLLRDLGLSAPQASAIFGSFGIALVAGRVVVGALVDRLWAPGVAAVALCLPAVGCVLLSLANAQTATPLLVLAVGLVGVGAGAEFDLSAYLVSKFFGMKDYGRLFGLHLGMVTAGSMLAPLLFAAMYRATGGYGSLLAYCTACCIIGPVLLLTLGRKTAAPAPLATAY